MNHVDHTWLETHSTTNELTCIMADSNQIHSLIAGVSSTPKRAVITTQIHFRMLLRMAGVTISDGVREEQQSDEWPDPRMS